MAVAWISHDLCSVCELCLCWCETHSMFSSSMMMPPRILCAFFKDAWSSCFIVNLNTCTATCIKCGLFFQFCVEEELQFISTNLEQERREMLNLKLSAARWGILLSGSANVFLPCFNGAVCILLLAFLQTKLFLLAARNIKSSCNIPPGCPRLA